jgi:hypothetical protein
LWLTEYGEYRPDPALAGDMSVHTAVIDGGLTGLAAAIALKAALPSWSDAHLTSNLTRPARRGEQRRRRVALQWVSGIGCAV